jgi:hypothetical protein
LCKRYINVDIPETFLTLFFARLNYNNKQRTDKKYLFHFNSFTPMKLGINVRDNDKNDSDNFKDREKKLLIFFC